MPVISCVPAGRRSGAPDRRGVVDEERRPVGVRAPAGPRRAKRSTSIRAIALSSIGLAGTGDDPISVPARVEVRVRDLEARRADPRPLWNLSAEHLLRGRDKECGPSRRARRSRRGWSRPRGPSTSSSGNRVDLEHGRRCLPASAPRRPSGSSLAVRREAVDLFVGREAALRTFSAEIAGRRRPATWAGANRAGPGPFSTSALRPVAPASALLEHRPRFSLAEA